jgi:uncharacterized membrane protein YtjA (UPF0391 family)
MMYLAAILLLLTLAAAIFGFGAIISAGVYIAQVLFWVFLILLVITLFVAAAKGGGRPVRQ